MAGRESPVGRTKDAGWEIGVSRTVGLDVEALWERITSAEGLAIWLGDVVGGELPVEPGAPYRTADGTTGEVRSFRRLDRLRLTHRPPGAERDSTVQIALSTAPSGRTRITFHQERLSDAAERERQRAHWQSVAERLLG